MNRGARATFLGLDEKEEGPWDVVILPIPFEMTTSWVEGTERGPAACIEASSQVELYDPLLPEELPCGLSFHTSSPWSSEAGTLMEQLNSITEFISEWIDNGFPLVLGGEHGILPPIMEAMKKHPRLNGDLSNLTLVQIDAHADLRDELNGERFSHGTVIRRSLDAGVGRVIQIGTRALSKSEAIFSCEDDRVETWYAREILGSSGHLGGWELMLKSISQIKGLVWITFDIDGLDGKLVPSTGTPVPGGLSHWEAVEVIERIFSATGVEVLGADVNEISPGKEGPLTEFNAALIATKILSCHCARILNKKGE